jgi:hypothetical protein
MTTPSAIYFNNNDIRGVVRQWNVSPTHVIVIFLASGISGLAGGFDPICTRTFVQECHNVAYLFRSTRRPARHQYVENYSFCARNME